jgi:tRNA pseudouridine38-40 synthase
MAAVRYKVTIAYRGTRYHGWQRQMPAITWKGETPAAGKGIPTVQETIADALGRVLGHPIEIVGSSRTDAGVHAKAQIAHFDSDQAQIPPWGMLLAANHQLPPDVLIRRIAVAPPGFDAITCADSKRYQYAIWAEELRNPFVNDLVWHRWQPLDHEAMAAAAAHFVGTHDFASFCRPGHKRENTVRCVLECEVTRRGPMIVIGVTGTGFLWNMVRIIAGTLVEVGLGQFTPDDIPRMIAALDRRAAGSTAPPHGLYLQWIRLHPPAAPIADS